MKIIITENQLKDKVHQMVKTEGWNDTCQTLGLSGEELAEMFFNDDPMEFLNLYNDLDIVQIKDKPNLTLFRYKPKNNLMVYDRKNDLVYIQWEKIWSFLRLGFDLNYTEIKELTKKWLSEVYNLRGVTTQFHLRGAGILLSEVYNLK